MNMIKPMLPTLYPDTPKGEDWVYEVKYDGFRCLVLLEQNKITLQSRNGKLLNEHFPEIIQFIENLMQKKEFAHNLPLIFDGELAILTSPLKANFASIQKRGRTKTKAAIETLSKSHPGALLIFDLLQLSGKNLHSLPFQDRKEKLKELFKKLALPLSPSFPVGPSLQYVPFFLDSKRLWEEIKLHHGEGVVAKKLHSPYQEGKRTADWIKIKNFQSVICYITKYQKDNGYFHVAVFDHKKVIPIGLFSHGLNSEERQALITVIKENSVQEDAGYIYVKPGICVELFYLELYQNQLRHPEFKQFRFDVNVHDCTWENIRTSNLSLPESVAITHPEKPLWEDPHVVKMDFLHYLMEVSPYLLPFLQDRLLTVIRYPHGMFGESFYQKNCPDYAPSFVNTHLAEGIDYILCNNLETLLWLGNQLAIEFHIPFQQNKHSKPAEIVFDLDPPSADFFQGAVKAAMMMKEVFDQLELYSFIKTSGRKGLQLYIPLPDDTFTYEETRKFTEFIADYLVSKEPTAFTVERLKKNRGNKVYIDYVQHAAGKTIIAPYSLRGNQRPTIAAPLFWKDVNDSLAPEQFTIYSVSKRLKEKGDPFHDYFQIKEKQPFEQVLSFLKQV